MKIKSKAILALFLGAFISFGATSCNNDDNFVDNEEDENETTETIYPVNFRFITFNHQGNYGEKPSISYIANDGSVYADYLMDVNSFQVKDNPMNALQINNRMFLVHGSYFSDNGILEVNPNTFEIIREINLKGIIRSYTAVNIDDNTLVVAGESMDTDDNVIVVDLTADDESLVKSQMAIDLPIHAMTRVGNKIFMASATTGNPLMVMNIDNITEGGVRTISENCRLTNRYNQFVKDKNGNLWIATISGSRVKMVCINPETEAIEKEIEMPYSMTTLNETAYTIGNDGVTLYVRNHKAFYKLDVNNPQELDEPSYEFRDHVGLLKDLKITENGSLIIINQRQGSFTVSEVIEFDPTATGDWELARVDIGYIGSSIYVPNYEKKY